jgi:hypothetical protein
MSKRVSGLFLRTMGRIYSCTSHPLNKTVSRFFMKGMESSSRSPGGERLSSYRCREVLGIQVGSDRPWGKFAPGVLPDNPAFGNETRGRGKNGKGTKKLLSPPFKKESPPKSSLVACAKCGKELILEVPPSGNDLLCLDFYKKK